MDEHESANFSFPLSSLDSLNGTVDEYRTLNLDNIFETHPWMFWILVSALTTIAITLIVVTIYCLKKNKRKVINRESNDVSELYGDGLTDIGIAGKKILKCLRRKPRNVTGKSKTQHAPQDVVHGDHKSSAYKFAEQHQSYAVPPQAVQRDTADLRFDLLGQEVSQIIGVPVVKINAEERRPLPNVKIEEFEEVEL